MNYGHANLPRPAARGDTFADVEMRWVSWMVLDCEELERTPRDSWRYQVLLRCIALDERMANWARSHRRKGVAA